MKLVKSLFLLSAAVLLIACEGIIGVTGIVLDEDTGNPIENVIIDLNNGLNMQLTDSCGRFNVAKFVGMVRPIHPIIKCTQEGYKPFEFESKSTKDGNSYIVKSEIEYINLDEPFYPDPDNKLTYLVAISIEKWSQNFMVKNDTVIIFLKRIPLDEVEDIKKGWWENE